MIQVPAPAPGLKSWREFRRLTQRQLGAEVGVTQSMVWRWERGHCPRVDQARALVRVLGAPSLEALFPSDQNGAAA